MKPRPKGWGFFMSTRISRRGICYHLNYCFARLSYTRTRGTGDHQDLLFRIVVIHQEEYDEQWDLCYHLNYCFAWEVVIHDVRNKCSQRTLMNSPNVSEYCHTCETTCYPRRILRKNKFKKYTRNNIVYPNNFRTFV
jgi:hypothetical protein